MLLNLIAMKKIDVIELMKNGSQLVQKKYPDFGTTSLFKPIKRTGKTKSTFTIDGQSVSSKTGYSIVNDKNLGISYRYSREGLVDILVWFF